MKDIPAPSLHPTAFKAKLVLRALREDFPTEKIIDSASAEDKKIVQNYYAEIYEFKVVLGNRICYMNYPHFKTECPESIVLIFLIDIYKKYFRSGPEIMRELRNCGVELKK